MAEKILKRLVSREEIKDVLKNRSKEYYQISVKKGTEKPYFEEGWELYKGLKTVTQLRKQKDIGEQFEDKVWCTLAKMGFEEISADRKFEIPLFPNGGRKKQIDIFLKEKNVVVVIECKTTTKLKPVHRFIQLLC